MTRRHAIGDEWERDSIRYRIVAGTKTRQNGTRFEDQVLEMWAPPKWVRLKFEVAYIMVDVIGQNEDARYPPPNQGGAYLLNELQNAYTEGWQVPAGRTAEERQQAQRKVRPRMVPVYAEREREVGLVAGRVFATVEEVREAWSDKERRKEVRAWLNTVPMYPRGVLCDLLLLVGIDVLSDMGVVRSSELNR